MKPYSFALSIILVVALIDHNGLFDVTVLRLEAKEAIWFKEHHHEGGCMAHELNDTINELFMVRA